MHLRGWCRSEGHSICSAPESDSQTAVIRPRSPTLSQRWQGAERAGGPDPLDPAAVVERPPQRWGLAARGALIESGSPAFHFALADKAEVWAADAVRLYAQATAAQWDPATAIPWDAEFDLPDEVEDAVVQIMTYLVENETAALIVPSRFIAQLHPHFREVMQLLAVQAADEARHMEVFTRRALLKGRQLGLSTAGGQASLQTLVEEPDFAIASFLSFGAWGGHLPDAARVPRTLCAGPGDRGRVTARRSGRSAACCVWDGAPAASTSKRIRMYSERWQVRSAGAMSPPPHLRVESGSL